MSDFDYQPAYGAQVDHEPRVLSATFGDGYEQATGDGINTDQGSWNLVFTRTSSDIVAIEAFLKLKGGYTSFTWTPDGESEITVRCKKWSRVRVDNGAQGISATFQEVNV